ncbi:sec-independent protein translocase protein TATB, chloroplastic isoform X2 [Magnolia sinica]|uniref:sec-independent protein translocase protein TATB, chloroplastic isoform X2 n=1 Tax=Magnolia sinica TaxID=86752 RepID=UPI002658E27A|nr:sec-independent protein translocase protein TATB, chloroplastic isoform X2 [Magnolia sinica]
MAASATLFLSFPSSIQSKSPNVSISAIFISNPKTPKFHHPASISQMGAGLSSPWSGLKHLGISISQRYVKREKGRCKGRVVYASLFGVGAPEALVIGVVALLVFGPKGLAEVARNLGQTLRAFQPTIRELQEVSRDFKSTLEREIGLDEVATSIKSTVNSTPSSPTEKPPAKVDPNGTPPTNSLSSSEEALKATEEIPTVPVAEQQAEATGSPEEQLTASVATQQVEAPTTEEQPTGIAAEQKAEAPTTEEQPAVIAAEQKAEAPTTEEQPAVFAAEQKAEAPINEEQPTVIAAEQKAEALPSFEEPLQVGATAFEKRENER